VAKGGLAEALAAAGLTRDRVIGHADEIRVGLLGQVRRRWGRCGVRLRQRIQRKRRYRSLFLAVDVRGGRLWYCWLDSMKGDEFCGVLRGIERADVLDALVWDGAPGHRDARVGRIGVPLIPLPASSPELNPAERLFEAMRRSAPRSKARSTPTSTPSAPASRPSSRRGTPTPTGFAPSPDGPGSSTHSNNCPKQARPNQAGWV
jgi:hypothetical protein